MKTMIKSIVWVIVFSIAMGFLESAVVIYLRALFYPQGFQFPLTPIPLAIARVEFFRELATVIMLVCIGILAGRSKLERFAYFVIAFAIWDLFYYVFLYLCLGWPESLKTWDILFLIPLPWVGPVWAPCLLCLLMLSGAFYILYVCRTQPLVKIPLRFWLLMIGGALTCIVSFMWDYFRYSALSRKAWSIMSSDQLFADLLHYVPTDFNLPLFFAGFFAMCLSLLLFILKTNTYEKHA